MVDILILLAQVITRSRDVALWADGTGISKKERMKKKELEGSWSLGNNKNGPELFC